MSKERNRIRFCGIASGALCDGYTVCGAGWFRVADGDRIAVLQLFSCFAAGISAGTPIVDLTFCGTGRWHNAGKDPIVQMPAGVERTALVNDPECSAGLENILGTAVPIFIKCPPHEFIVALPGRRSVGNCNIGLADVLYKCNRCGPRGTGSAFGIIGESNGFCRSIGLHNNIQEAVYAQSWADWNVGWIIVADQRSVFVAGIIGPAENIVIVLRDHGCGVLHHAPDKASGSVVHIGGTAVWLFTGKGNFFRRTKIIGSGIVPAAGAVRFADHGDIVFGKNLFPLCMDTGGEQDAGQENGQRKQDFSVHDKYLQVRLTIVAYIPIIQCGNGKSNHFFADVQADSKKDFF